MQDEYAPSDIAKALDGVLDNLGQPTKTALLHHLSASYQISLNNEMKKTLSITKIEDALKSMLGDGHSIIMSWLYEKLDNN